MKLQHIFLFATVFLGMTSAHDTPPSYAAELTTTVTTTEFTTVTQTATQTTTRTREIPCPAVQTGVLDFDDLVTTAVSAMPLVYQDFTFPADSSWEYLIASGFPASAAESRSVRSRPNGLFSRARGPVSFGSQGGSFSFDVTSVAFFAFAAGAAETLRAEVSLFMADGYTETHSFDVQNAALNSTLAPTLLGAAQLGAFKDLVQVAVAVWVSYDQSSGEGVPAQFVLDDVEYVKRSCGGGGGGGGGGGVTGY